MLTVAGRPALALSYGLAWAPRFASQPHSLALCPLQSLIKEPDLANPLRCPLCQKLHTVLKWGRQKSKSGWNPKTTQRWEQGGPVLMDTVFLTQATPTRTPSPPGHSSGDNPSCTKGKREELCLLFPQPAVAASPSPRGRASSQT